MNRGRKTLVAVAVVAVAALAGGAFAYQRHAAHEASRAEALQKAAADRQALERKCIGVRYRLSQRQNIDLKGKTADTAFIEANCEPAHL